MIETARAHPQRESRKSAKKSSFATAITLFTRFSPPLKLNLSLCRGERSVCFLYITLRTRQVISKYEQEIRLGFSNDNIILSLLLLAEQKKGQCLKYLIILK